MKKILAFAAAMFAALALSLSLAPAPAASANAQPVAYDVNWTHPTIRPQWELVTADSGAFAHTWSWNLHSTYAYSLGTLWLNTCVPYCAASHYKYYAVGVTLSAVKKHRSTPYWSKMQWSFWLGGRHYVYHYTFTGLAPAWSGPIPYVGMK